MASKSSSSFGKQTEHCDLLTHRALPSEEVPRDKAVPFKYYTQTILRVLISYCFCLMNNSTDLYVFTFTLKMCDIYNKVTSFFFIM